MRQIHYLALAATIFAAQPATGQAPSESRPPAPNPFAEFFRPLIGTWPVHIIDRDAQGNVEYETTQLRDFRFAVGGGFVRETAIVRDGAGRQLEVGFHLYGHERAGNRVLLHGFWGNSADRFLLVDGRIEGQGRETRMVGTMAVSHPDGRVVRSRSEMGWESADRFFWRTYSERADGTSYLDEELVYTVAPVETLTGR